MAGLGSDQTESVFCNQKNEFLKSKPWDEQTSTESKKNAFFHLHVFPVVQSDEFLKRFLHHGDNKVYNCFETEII